MQGPLVEGSWLAERPDDPQLRVVDLRPIEDYHKGHLRDAVSVPMTLLRTTVDGIPGMAISAESLEQLMGGVGISNDSLVVGYDDSGGIDAARLFWTMEYYGHDRVAVLDGTTALWRAEGRKLDSTSPRVEPTRFRATPQPSRIATLAHVLAALGSEGTVLVDARTPQEYLGQQTGSTGHIPGAVNVEWVNHLQPGEFKRLKPLAELRNLYEAVGATPDKEIVVYCRTGHRAAHSYLVLRLLGYPRIRLYDGSWAEWSSKSELPVER